MNQKQLADSCLNVIENLSDAPFDEDDLDLIYNKVFEEFEKYSDGIYPQQLD